MGYAPPFTRTPAIDDLCMQIAEHIGALGPTTPLLTSSRLHRELRIRTIRSSLMIEGNTLSHDAVTAIIDGKRVLGPAREIREVENANRAYGLMEELDPYSLADLLRAHGVMMAGLVDDAGRFRNANAGVFDGERLIHAGTPAAYVPEVMADLFGWMSRTDLHPLLVSCIFHCEFEFIHPFTDGNGRTGRLWHTLLLSRWRPVLAWLPIETVIRDRQQDYYAALARSNAAGSCEDFVAFILTVIRDALVPYASSGTEARSAYADERTSRTLTFLSEEPTATVADLAAHLGCSRRTAERVIADLRASGRLVREGSARAGRWRVPGPEPNEA
ncbi:MAG: Fic family protein [Actinomyces ruminicola]|uniref:Fic family protein n=2 Tax=Actinomyces ruminicola TaxID=332524 RepID=A0A1G9SZD3_9ACTO|nr:Fic family protein [Actinomyces ruminicola]MBE6482602.1 Fic family protein [Actinomyces ruminicola]SDM40225.1 Fic family protein [Actinomyces ruminicola]